MKILIGADVDPSLPERLAARPDDDIWWTIDRVSHLLDAFGDDLPAITWLIRSDKSVEFSTGDYASGYLTRRELWQSVLDRGHQLGWHMHLMSFDPDRGYFVFDGRPDWLEEAHGALANHFPIRATRTGWDLGSDFLFGELDRLGVTIDFSALPGNRVWHSLGEDSVHVDWLRCAGTPYRPSADDYQRPGASPLKMIEVPVAQFDNTPVGKLRRLANRARHGCFSSAGLGNKTLMLTEPWTALPRTAGDTWAFFFHPEDLTHEGVAHFVANVARLRARDDVEFVTADQAVSGVASTLREA